MQRQAGNRALAGLVHKVHGEHAAKEREAETGAERLGRDWDRAGPPTTSLDAAKLDPASRRFLERRVAVDLDTIRVHDDDASHRLTDRLGAEAVTVAKDVYIGRASRSDPRRLRRVLGHELTHVAQQARAGVPAVQAKLKLTGGAAEVDRLLALLNSGLYLKRVTVDKAGSIALQTLEGPPAPGHPSTTEQALANRLTTMINDAKDVIVSVSAGSQTLVGSYTASDLDISDLEALGVSALVHELEEQFQKQAKGVGYGTETTGAHGQGIVAESEVRGAKRGPQKVLSSSMNADGSIDAVIEIPFTDAKGKVVTDTLTIKSSNVVSVTRK